MDRIHVEAQLTAARALMSQQPTLALHIERELLRAFLVGASFAQAEDAEVARLLLRMRLLTTKEGKTTRAAHPNRLVENEVREELSNVGLKIIETVYLRSPRIRVSPILDAATAAYVNVITKEVTSIDVTTSLRVYVAGHAIKGQSFFTVASPHKIKEDFLFFVCTDPRHAWIIPTKDVAAFAAGRAIERHMHIHSGTGAVRIAFPSRPCVYSLRECVHVQPT